MKYLITYISIIVMFIGLDTQAQRTQSNRGPSLSIGFQVVEPIKEFGEFYEGNPVGIGGQFLINGGRSPFAFGVGYAWQSMGKTDDEIKIYEGEDIDGDAVYGSGHMNVNSNIYTYHMIGRFIPLAGKVQPYAELVAGFKTFSTKSTILADNGSYTEVISEDVDAKDFAASFGWSVGLKLQVAGSLMLEGRVSVLEGGETQFIDPESIEIDKEGFMNFETITSKTDAMVYQLGISIQF